MAIFNSYVSLPGRVYTVHARGSLVLNLSEGIERSVPAAFPLPGGLS